MDNVYQVLRKCFSSLHVYYSIAEKIFVDLVLLFKRFLYADPFHVMENGTEVKLYIYDLTKGLAQQLSQVMLGKYRSIRFIQFIRFT